MAYARQYQIWSKLQRDIYALFSPDINIQLHTVAYPMRSQRGHSNLPRYWITLDKEIIWDYPKDFKDMPFGTTDDYLENRSWCHGSLKDIYPYGWEEPTISDCIREYINTPKEELLTKSFEYDRWGLTDLLKAADRRFGKRKLLYLKLLKNEKVNKIINARLGNK
jgi:hypothetical protein